MNRKKLLLCGATGFIGRNLLARFLEKGEYELYATYFRTAPPELASSHGVVTFLNVDLTNKSQVHEAVAGMDIVIQAAAMTSGARDIVTKPHDHVADNAIMNSLIFRACHESKVQHVLFFSCTIMYPSGTAPVTEEDFDGRIMDKYFGAGWTKVYLEKMCEFYSRIGQTQYTAIRHSNIYGPFDKYDFEKSHVFGATVAKVMSSAEPGTITVWGNGSEERDLLYIDDLTEFVEKVLVMQKSPFELINVGGGISICVADLARRIIRQSGKNLKIEFDNNKPTIPFSLKLNIDRASRLYQWSPKTSLDKGIAKTLEWYRSYHRQKQEAL